MPYSNVVSLNRTVTNKVIGTVKTVLFDGDGLLDLQRVTNKVFTVYNGGEPALAAGVLEVAPDSGGPWATLIAIAGGTLGSATVWNYSSIDTSYKWWKLSAAVASGSVATVSAYFRGN